MEERTSRDLKIDPCSLRENVKHDGKSAGKTIKFRLAQFGASEYNKNNKRIWRQIYMANISNDKNGTKRLRFKDHNDKWYAIRLGAVNKKQADLVRSRVEAIVSAKILGQSFDAETSRWLADIGDELHEKLAKTGIIEARLTTTLGDYCDQFLAKVKTKESTKRTMKQTTDTIIKYFGYEIDPKSITVEMVELLSESMKKARLLPIGEDGSPSRQERKPLMRTQCASSFLRWRGDLRGNFDS